MNITIDKAVLEQVLAALEQINSPYWSYFVTPHIAQLREALAQPQPVQEPVATVQCIHGVTIGYLEVMQPVGTKLYTFPQAQAAQPLTVAGGAVFQDAEGKRPVTAIGQPVGRWEPTPLYPPGCAGVFLERPQAQPLSDEQIQEAVTQAVKDGNLSWLGFKKDGMGMYTVPDLSPAHYQLARAIEQAHGIKGTT